LIEQKISILIADDHQLVLEGMVKLLEKTYPASFVMGVYNGKEVLKALKVQKFDILLMDLDMPEMDGFDASAEVLRSFPDTRILIISGFSDEKYIYHLVELGVHGFLQKNARPEELFKAIKNILANGLHYTDEMVRVMRNGIILKSTKPNFRLQSELSQRDKDVLKLICLEKTTRQIADSVFLSERTVEKIRASLAAKLDVKGTAGLVRYAVRNGLDI
jgi:DNA-binding NarL/FixJ family response regulator